MPAAKLKISAAWLLFAWGTWALIALAVWTVDPLGVHSGIRIKGFNAEKLAMTSYSRISKPIQVGRINPRCIVVGTSSAEEGYSCETAAWRIRPAYNLGINGGSLRESLDLMKHACLTSGRLERCYFTLDFSSFAEGKYVRPAPELDYRSLATGSKERRNFDGTRTRLSFSPRLISLSLETIRSQNAYNESSKLTEWGARSPDAKLQAVQSFGKLGLHRYRESGYVERGYFMANDPLFSARITSEETFSPSVVLGEAAEFSRQQGFDLHFILQPIHVRHHFLIDALGLGGQFREWKRKLSELDTGSVKVWDFCQINPFTVESVHTEEVAYFPEGIHFKQSLGDRVIDSIENGSNPVSPFGTRLSKVTVETDLQTYDDALEEARQTFADDYSDILKTVSAAARPDHNGPGN